MNGQAAVRRVDLANKQEQEHVINIVMAFKMMISKKHKVAIMATVQVNIDASKGCIKIKKSSTLLNSCTFFESMLELFLPVNWHDHNNRDITRTKTFKIIFYRMLKI